tara:strand:+ start:1669 stop:1884 length:216 start_codon:yes stop_codon:yes gene_type:complete
MENTLKTNQDAFVIIQLGGHQITYKTYKQLVENLNLQNEGLLIQQKRVEAHLQNIADSAVREYLWDNYDIY